MSFDIALIIILGVLVAYAVLINLYTIFFQLSGLSWAKSRFQVISLLTNSGFTTRESEVITSNRLRRKIAMAVMLTGHIFSIVIISLFVNLVFSFDAEQVSESIWIIAIAAISFVLLLVVIRLPKINEAFSKMLKNASIKILKNKGKNVLTVFDEIGEDAVCEIILYGLPEFLNEKRLEETHINTKYGINVLSVIRNHKSIQVNATTIIGSGDIILVFGNLLNIKDIFLKEKIIKPEELTEKDNVINLLDNYGDNAIVEVQLNAIPEFIANKPLSETNIREVYHIFILSVVRRGNDVLIDGNTRFEQYDHITIFGPYNSIKQLFITSRNQF